ncbi:unnamed protein product [Hermetia illucens]|uniref:FERM and PDZ domain-containing protein 4 n=1 Tax=Hermetia illucens TaxID=343691 RepID=A0A7R8V8L0_HERIL|nr:unnamed protein product [Hermetia illucens]
MPPSKKCSLRLGPEGGPNCWDLSRHLDVLQDTLKDGWTVHTGKDGRLYYCNHITRTAGWLPPAENWPQNIELPYGWEKAVDPKGRSYFINHLNKTTTYEAPDWVRWDDTPPEPRVVVLQRSPTVGFGFVAGSERPVIVRFVTEGGPSVNKLQAGDHILAVNGEDVKDAPRDHVIQLVRSCESQVTLLVCQPASNLGAGRKSTLLSAGKRAKLRTRPSRVRFAESVCVNGAPLFPPSAFSLGDLCVPPMANVLKVFLENGQTKSFKYDATTKVQDVVSSLRDKLCISAVEHFSLVLEHVKSLKRNKLTLLDADETLARIAARPGAHKLRCLFRVTFVPVSAAELAQRDLNSLDYLYMQCCNDVTQERFAPELQPDVALRLAALHIHQHALANNVSPAKLTVKVVEREFGLERFVPSSLIEGMKRKELRRLIAHFLKLNSQMTGSSTKMLTQLQAKIHYLDIISGLPSYGAKCFSTNQRDGVERVLLISPRFGLSQITGIRNSVPQPISTLQDLIRVSVHREDDITKSVTVQMHNERVIKFIMEDRDACEFALVLAGYYRLLTGKELVVDREQETLEEEDNSPPFLAEHTVLPATWSYLLPYHNRAHTMNFLMPPTYQSIESITSGKIDKGGDNNCDRNMNTNTMPNHNHKLMNCDDEFGYDAHSVMAMELLENAKDNTSTILNGVIEARNEEVLRRVAEMQRMVESSEQYLNEHGELIHEYEMKSNCRQPWSSTSVDLDSDCESLNSSKVSSNEDAPPPGALKHSDSLVLLAEAISQDLSGITKGLNSINTNLSNEPDSNSDKVNASNAQKVNEGAQRKVNGLSQLLSDLQSLGQDYSQSESDSESVHTPSTSPTQRRATDRQSDGRRQRNNAIRTSFGLHSPDSAVLVGPADSREHNLKEYLRQLKELSSVKDAEEQENDLDAAKKLSEMYGFEIDENTIIETDPDLIDLRALPPPPTPDELDALSLLNAAPRGFDDSAKSGADDGDLDKFLAKVIVAPPTQKATPAKELTPEEIMSFIIPPPPSLENAEKNKDAKSSKSSSATSYKQNVEENLYSNSSNNSKIAHSNQDAFQSKNITGPHVIDYSTVERKGAFSCCPKTVPKKEDPVLPSIAPEPIELKLPPRKCPQSNNTNPPARPPKSIELQNKINSPTNKNPYSPTNSRLANNIHSPATPPTLPPRSEDGRPVVLVPPKKYPPIAARPVLRVAQPPVKPVGEPASSPVRVAGIGSPHLHRNLSIYRDIDNAFTSSTSPAAPVPLPRSNGHARSNSDCPPVCLKNPSQEQRPQLSLLCSPQFARKNSAPANTEEIINNSQNNGFNVLNGEALLAKTDVAMAGLLVKLDQVAAQCSAAHTAGGGANIDEAKFQRARDELTEQALTLVTSSKLLVVAMSDATLSSLPEHLTSCLTSLRRITELTQDMTRHTSSPLQTRNIVLKVHDVASSFRELAGVQVGPLGAGQLALQAECLANVLATLLRSLRVFSP